MLRGQSEQQPIRLKGLRLGWRQRRDRADQPGSSSVGSETRSGHRARKDRPACSIKYNMAACRAGTRKGLEGEAPKPSGFQKSDPNAASPSPFMKPRALVRRTRPRSPGP
jgi:hypothetical protein